MAAKVRARKLLTQAVEYAASGGLIFAAYNQFIAPGYTWDNIKNFLINIPTTFKNSWQNYVYGAIVLLIGLGLINSYKAKKDIPMALKALGLFLVAMYGSAYIFGGIKGVTWGTTTTSLTSGVSGVLTGTTGSTACAWTGQPFQIISSGGQTYKAWQQTPGGQTCKQNIATGQLAGMN